MISRGLEYTANAKKLIIVGDLSGAKNILNSYIELLTTRRDSYNRMRFVWANLISLVVIVFLWIILKNTEVLSALNPVYTLGVPKRIDVNGDSTPENTFHLLDVLILGAIGAFFSVQSKVQNLRIAHSLTVSEMIYTGFVRVPVGIIAAGVSILLVSGDWILGGLDDTSRYYSVYLLGFVAGFAEQFVPNVLGRIESTSRADLNGASDTAPG